MNEQAMKFRLGIFVLGAAVLLGVLIILFGEFPTFLSPQVQYTVTFAHAPGVEQGTPVRKSGVRIGEVVGFDLNPDSGEVTVRIAVDKDQLRRGDRALLARGLIMGDTTVNFAAVEGSDRSPAQEGHVFQGEPLTDFNRAMDRVSELVPSAQNALEQISSTAKSINEFVPQLRRTNDEVQVAARNFGRASERVEVLIQTNEDKVTKVLDNVMDVSSRAASVLSPENERALNATLKSFRNTSESLESMSKNANELVADGRKTLKNVGDRVDTLGQNAEELVKEARGTLKKLNETLTRSDEVLGNLKEITTPLAERSASIVKHIEEGAARFSRITQDFADFSKALAEGDGTLRRIVSDPALYNSLNDTAASLKKSIGRFDRIMQDISVFTDKIARHPELLGIRGAVHPSSGLKEGPSTFQQPMIRSPQR